MVEPGLSLRRTRERGINSLPLFGCEQLANFFPIQKRFEELAGQTMSLQHSRRHTEPRLWFADAQRAAEVALAEHEMSVQQRGRWARRSG